jgi:hypothetical protein
VELDRESSRRRIKPQSNVDEITSESGRGGSVRQSIGLSVWGFASVPDRARNDSGIARAVARVVPLRILNGRLRGWLGPAVLDRLLLLRSRARVRACARYGVLVVGEEMKGSRTLLRKVLPQREREEAAVPEAIERLISRGPPAGSGIPFEAWRSWHRYGSLPVRPRSFGIPVPTIAAGWALIAASWMGH